MTAFTPRVLAPDRVPRGELFEVKVIGGHPMETGLRRDARGEVIPRKIIHTFVCRYGDAVAFSVDLRESVAANPFFEFFLRATTSARLTFTWLEDGGGVYDFSRDLTVI